MDYVYNYRGRDLKKKREKTSDEPTVRDGVLYVVVVFDVGLDTHQHLKVSLVAQSGGL